MRSAFYNLVNIINMTGTRDVYGAAAKIILQNIYKIPNCNIVDVAKMCYEIYELTKISGKKKK